MKTLLLSIILIISFSGIANIIYVDNNDAVYPYMTSTQIDVFDVNGDGENDLSLTRIYGTSQISCGSTLSTGHVTALFKGLTNNYGNNKVNGPVTNDLGYDCTGDTLNAFDEWNLNSRLYYGFYPQNDLCQDIGVGNHKQGFRLIKDMPTGGSGYIFGYIDYTITPGGDIIIHGWYYEDAFNVPIIANTLLDYPYDPNCLYYDTTYVYDTVQVMVYDTTYVTVTDTLYIDINDASMPSVLISTMRVYPNPTSDHITIDNGNFATLSNYEIKIVDVQGQSVFQSLITQQSFYIDVTAWNGTGIYYLTVYDGGGVAVTTRKIVID